MRYLLFLIATVLAAQTAPPNNVLDARSYDWYRTAGIGVSGDLSASGAGKTLTFSKCPPLLTTYTRVRVYDGTGTPELVVPTGGSCLTPGTYSGTVVVTTAQNHTGAWKVGSATSGIQEGSNTNGGKVKVGSAARLYGPVEFQDGSPSDSQYVVEGISRSLSFITVDPTFPTSASGVFIFNVPEPGPILKDFTITFTQPDSADRGTYTQWPPVIYATSVPRIEVHDITILGAWDGFDLVGNCGGSMFSGVWMTAYNKGIQIDGSVGTISISEFFFAQDPASTANQQSVFLNNGDILGMEVGRMDDLKLEHSLFINQKAIRFWEGTDTNGAFAHLTDVGFDTSASLFIEKGSVSISNSYFTSASTALYDSIVMTGGKLQMNNIWYFTGNDTTSFIDADIAAGVSSLLTLTNANIESTAVATTRPPIIDFNAAAGSSTLITLANNQFSIPSSAWTTPFVRITNTPGTGVLHFLGNMTGGQVGTTVFLEVATDDWHHIANNTFYGATSDYPVTKTLGNYQDAGEVVFGAGVTVRASTASIVALTTGPNLNIVGIPTYADNAAALGGGLVAGNVYRTAAGVLMVVF